MDWQGAQGRAKRKAKETREGGKTLEELMDLLVLPWTSCQPITPCDKVCMLPYCTLQSSLVRMWPLKVPYRNVALGDARYGSLVPWKAIWQFCIGCCPQHESP